MIDGAIHLSKMVDIPSIPTHECSPIERSLVSFFPSLLLKSPAIRKRALDEYRVVIESRAE